jgi:hypothetical protein
MVKPYQQDVRGRDTLNNLTTDLSEEEEEEEEEDLDGH